MTLTYFTAKSNFVTFAFLKEKMKKVDFSETIAACDLKLMDLMKICEYFRSRSFLDLGQMSFIDEDLPFFSQKPLAHFQPIFECKLGIRGNVHAWVKEFLSGREQRVIVNGSQSTWINITCGIPQGNVLGPVLFLVFINDLPEVIKVLIKLLADDAKLYSVVTSNADNRAQFSLNRAVDWSKVWKMIFLI